MLERIAAIRKRRGSALAELMVALALLAIVSTMIVSFSAIVNKFVDSEQSQYTFFGETSAVHEKLSTWLSELDEEGTVYTVSADRVEVSNSVASLYFDDFRQSLILTHSDGTLDVLEFATVQNITFSLKQLSAGSAIVKCTVLGSDSFNDQYVQSFIMSLRCGSFVG